MPSSKAGHPRSPSFEHDGAAAAEQDAMVKMRFNRPRQNAAFGILPLCNQIFDSVGMIDN